MVMGVTHIGANKRSYILRECLGRGGFGAVYRATARTGSGFQTEVALKFLNDHHNADPMVRGRLRDEARIVGHLRHRAIVKVLHLGVIQRRWSVVMEYLPGLTAEALITEGRVCPRHAVEIVAEVAAALDHAWNAPGPEGKPLRVMHRDIKPANIIITEHGEVKILDFGVARADLSTRESETRDGAFGTLSYMAPERFQMRQDASTDVYSLGATLFELITGEQLGPAKPKALAHNRMIEARIQTIQHRPNVLMELLVGSLLFSPEQRLDASGFYDLCQTLLAEEWLDEPTLKDWGERVIPLVMAQRVATTGDDPLLGAELFEEEAIEDLAPMVTVALPAPRAVHPQRADVAEVTTPLDTLGHAPRPSAQMNAAPQGADPRAVAAPPKPRPSGSLQHAVEVSGRFALRSAAMWTLGIGAFCAVSAAAVGAGLFERAPESLEPGLPLTSAAPAAAPHNLSAPASMGSAAEPQTEDGPLSPASTSPPELDRAAPPRPQAEPLKESLKGVDVRLTGDLPRIMLRGENGRFPVPGRVPPGEYELDFNYPGWERDPAWEAERRVVTIPNAPSITVVCLDMFARCTVR